MIPIIPSSITAIVVVSQFVIAAAIWSVLSLAAGRSGLPASARRRVRFASAAFLACWLGAVLLFAPAPASRVGRDLSAITPLIPIAFVLSVTASIVALLRAPSLRRALAAVPLPALHALQSWRTIGIVFVILYTRGRLPGHFALPAGWGDFAIGLTAPLVALALARRYRGAATVATLWNAIGLLDLVVAVGMGTGILAPLLAPELGSHVAPAAAMGAFPMILVPAFAVPASTLVHVVALVRLRAATRREAGVVSIAADPGQLENAH